MSKEELERGVSRLGLSVEDGVLDSLMRYANLLIGYRAANVIGDKKLDVVLVDHVLDSLSCYLVPRVSDAEKIIDVGTGGGLPGVPLKLVQPSKRLTLVESTRKKADFLRHVIETLSLEEVEVVNARVEDIGHQPRYREAYDVATVRAVAALPVVIEYAIPLIDTGGVVVAMKAHLSQDEMSKGRKAAELAGGKGVTVTPVPQLGEFERKERNLVVIEKGASTPQMYPRKTGIPNKVPLGG